MLSSQLFYNNVLIVSGTEKGKEYISTMLSNQRFESIVTANGAYEAKRLLIENSYDIIIVNAPLPDEFGLDFCIDITRNSYAGVLLMVKCDNYDQIAYKAEQYGVLTVAKPITKQSFYQAVGLIISTRERMRALEKKNESLKEKMEEIRIINRAKCILIEKLKMSETQAHRYIEKQSMDMRITKKSVSENVIKTYQN